MSWHYVQITYLTSTYFFNAVETYCRVPPGPGDSDGYVGIFPRRFPLRELEGEAYPLKPLLRCPLSEYTRSQTFHRDYRNLPTYLLVTLGRYI